MIEGTESVHLVHGPGSDAEALCLQISRGYLESDRVVAWIGDLAPALARPIIGSLGESSLENLRILNRDVKGIEGFLPGSDGLIVFIGCWVRWLLLLSLHARLARSLCEKRSVCCVSI